MKPADSYAIAALMVQVDGWERSAERRRIPLYGMQRMYCRGLTVPQRSDETGKEADWGFLS
jgi:hypothetical protein